MNDRIFKCDKCESKDVHVRYIGTNANTGPERLACKCKRCDHLWTEKPSNFDKENDES